MFSRKKIAAVSALLGGLAITGAGTPQAFAGGSAGDCNRSVMGADTCIQNRQTVHTKHGNYVVKQKKDCSSASKRREVWPELGLLNNGSTKVGPAMDCTNRAPLPKGFRPPHIDI
ncbi:hypothetical protein [Streptomyces natalensis]|uniref:Secreted protein n=1 Tax=Streptomyces natalensis ATCC 27448 TaxID=1240678 RepID=A0A0D7CRL6_9ACTN|nr:hypothetical protein [Streptomyces natalensis]KIZ18863.1 hypothetical protein SNA_06290 [Streptomyces natalensis ATCC 27448]